MTLWITVALAAMVIAAIGWWVVRHQHLAEPPPRDPDWGDWPSDQMAP